MAGDFKCNPNIVVASGECLLLYEMLFLYNQDAYSWYSTAATLIVQSCYAVKRRRLPVSNDQLMGF